MAVCVLRCSPTVFRTLFLAQLLIVTSVGSIISEPVYGPANHISSSSSSNACFQRIGDWLLDCVENHPLCVSGCPSTLPTRILDVGEDGEDVKLLESNGTIAPYACLSHCWGKKQIIATTTATLEERKRGIQLTQLSPTFQDAVTTTRRLKLQYLWIDSLCIVQDDKGDWERESKRMGSIYRGSHITIAASRSPDGAGGCFSKRPEYTQSQKLTINGVDIYVRRIIPPVVHETGSWRTHIRSFTTHVEESLLHSRAWAFQERILAVRTIQLYVEEIVWECMTKLQCECMRLDAEIHDADSGNSVP